MGSKLSKKIKKSSNVKVLCGSQKGKTFSVLKVLKDGRLLLSGFLYKTSVSASEDGSKKYSSKEIPVDISNVKLI